MNPEVNMILKSLKIDVENLIKRAEESLKNANDNHGMAWHHGYRTSAKNSLIFIDSWIKTMNEEEKAE